MKSQENDDNNTGHDECIDCRVQNLVYYDLIFKELKRGGGWRGRSLPFCKPFHWRMSVVDGGHV